MIPNYGTIYTCAQKKIAEHGVFADADLNVPPLIAHPKFSQKLIKTPVQTTQIAPTILEALRIDPDELEAGAEGAHGRATSLTEQKRISR